MIGVCVTRGGTRSEFAFSFGYLQLRRVFELLSLTRLISELLAAYSVLLGLYSCLLLSAFVTQEKLQGYGLLRTCSEKKRYVSSVLISKCCPSISFACFRKLDSPKKKKYAFCIFHTHSVQLVPDHLPTPSPPASLSFPVFTTDIMTKIFLVFSHSITYSASAFVLAFLSCVSLSLALSLTLFRI